MGLGAAINEEMKMKPPGSDLVIANSSETIIPAHEGLMPRTAFTANAGMNNMGGGDISIESINISGVNDPEEIASQVAEQILTAVRRSTYGELYTS